jgi:competence protein ComEA
VGLADARQIATATRTGPRVNINKASRAELEQLPGVGPATASRIVEHRERYGPFRRAEHLLLVRGFSDSRFRELRSLIEVD